MVCFIFLWEKKKISQKLEYLINLMLSVLYCSIAFYMVVQKVIQLLSLGIKTYSAF